MRTLMVAVMLVVPGLAHTQVAASVRARAQVIDARPSRDALGAARSARLGLTEGWVAAAGLAVVAERAMAAMPADRPRRATVVEISFLRN